MDELISLHAFHLFDCYKLYEKQSVLIATFWFRKIRDCCIDHLVVLIINKFVFLDD